MILTAPDRTTHGARDAGFSLVEAIVATVIATIAVVGLAHSFGLGRSFISRFELARAALGVAQRRLEVLQAGSDPSTNLATGITHRRDFYHGENKIGNEEWVVSWYDDPAIPDTTDLKQVTVRVIWAQGSTTDTVVLKRLFLDN